MSLISSSVYWDVLIRTDILYMIGLWRGQDYELRGNTSLSKSINIGGIKQTFKCSLGFSEVLYSFIFRPTKLNIFSLKGRLENCSWLLKDRRYIG